jgi:hypothetical protein
MRPTTAACAAIGTQAYAPEAMTILDTEATAEGRPGFQHLVAEVSLEHVGIVLGR